MLLLHMNLRWRGVPIQRVAGHTNAPSRLVDIGNSELRNLRPYACNNVYDRDGVTGREMNDTLLCN